MDDKYTRENINLFYQGLEMPGGYTWNHVKNLKKIDLYYNSQFESGAFDSQGFRKHFYNVVKPACDVATKFIDLDTKDIILVPDDSDSEYITWMMQKDLRQWLKENEFGDLLNTIAFDYPKYGHLVIKKDFKGKYSKTNLQNLRLDITSASLEDSPFVYEVHLMNSKEIDSMPWDKEAVKQLFDRGKEAQYAVYECYDYNTDGDKKWKLTIKADLFIKQRPNGGIQRSLESDINIEGANEKYLPAIVLFESELDELPYRELKWEHVPGRWLGFGFVEYLFDNQVRMNELANIKSKALYYTSLKVYQTRDETVGRNILTDIENGDILKVNSEVTQVDNAERNIGAFTQEESRWDFNTERKTFSSDITTGGDLPSRTPMGVANLSAVMASSYFDLKRENFGLFVRSLLLNDVIPSFKKERNKEHTLSFLGSDNEIDKLRKAVTEALLREYITEWVIKKGLLPDEMTLEALKADLENQLRQRKNIFLQIPDSFYANAKYHVDVLVTGEQVNTGARIQTLQVALQLLASNPMIVQNKATRTVFLKMLELTGISPVELNILNEQIEDQPQMPQEMMPQGGSVAMPQASQNMMGGNVGQQV